MLRLPLHQLADVLEVRPQRLREGGGEGGRGGQGAGAQACRPKKESVPATERMTLNYARDEYRVSADGLSQ